MMYKISSRRVVACVAGLAATALGAFLLAPSPLATAAPTPPGMSPVRVDASYRITLNGFNLGNFQFKSDVGRKRYTLDTDVEISALLGVFKWKGVTRTSGAIAANSPMPADFRFNYESSVKSGSVDMGFTKDRIERLTVLPATDEPADWVPVSASHLQGVLDPLSAILAITHSDAQSPCGRKVSIFDGKQRFDIALRFARKEPVAGIPNETAIVCRVKYIPIAGYRANEETRQLAETNDIEIVFRMVPAAKLMLPQSVSLPTIAGAARIDLEKVNVEVSDRGQLASVD